MSETALSTRRTRLRLVNLSDVNTIHHLHSLPETDEFNTLGLPANIEETKAIIESWISENKSLEKPSYIFVIEEKLDRDFIGIIGLKQWSKKHRRGELWYKLLPKHWNKGFATEVLTEMIDFGFDELNLHRLQAGCAVENVRSIKVLEKVGMIREGRGRQILPLKSGWSDNFEYSILETDKRKLSTKKD